MAISTLNLSFVDGTTVIDANKMNGIVNKINELVNYANNAGGDSTPSIVASPAITVSGNNCTITCSTSGATIKYTLDGTTPSASNGSTYSGAITLNSSCTIKAIAIKTGMTNSSVVSETYNATPSIVASPAITVSGNSCTITCSTSGATIKYTLDGSTPSASNGSTYSGAITLNSSCTIKAMAIKTGMTDSSVVSKTYTAPVASDVEVDTTDILELRTALVAKEEGVTSNSSYKIYQYCIAGITTPTTISIETNASNAAANTIIYLNSQGELISFVERSDDGVNTYSGNIPTGTAFIQVNCRSTSEASVHIFETSNSATLGASEVEVTNLDSLVTITNNTRLTTEGTETASNYLLYTYNLSSINGLSRINVVTKVGTTLTTIIQFLDSNDNILSYVGKVSTLYDFLIPSNTKKIRVTCYSPNSETPTVKIYRR